MLWVCMVRADPGLRIEGSSVVQCFGANLFRQPVVPIFAFSKRGDPLNCRGAGAGGGGAIEKRALCFFASSIMSHRPVSPVCVLQRSEYLGICKSLAVSVQCRLLFDRTWAVDARRRNRATSMWPSSKRIQLTAFERSDLEPTSILADTMDTCECV